MSQTNIRKAERVLVATSHYRDVQLHGSEYCTEPYRRLWMTDEQWRQAQACVLGRAIPADPEIVEAFRDCITHQNTRATVWAYGSVPGYLVGPNPYKWWCGFIAETIDQDLSLDVGL